MSEIAQTLDGVAGYYRAYVVTTDAQRDAAALWTFHTHAFDAAEATPYLHVTSAEKESGKTRFLEAAELVVARPLKTGGTTAAALARAVAQDPPPTMLLDETDNAFKRDREYVAALLGILNDGYRRGGRTLLCLPPKWEPSFLPVFAPKVVAGLGDLPDTLTSRSVRLELKRRAPDEPVERFRRREAEGRAEPLRLSLESLAAHHVDQLAEARPELPDELGDRAMDVWEPLLAIADLAGGDWPERARRAALELAGRAAEADDSIGVRLLTDCRPAFNGCDRLPTKDLIARLAEDEEAPWATWHKGATISPRALARLLEPFGIRSRTVRLAADETARGFLVEQFADVWKRYLPAPPPDFSDTTTQPAWEAGWEHFSIRHTTPPVSGRETASNPHGYGDVSGVSDKEPGEGARAPIPDDPEFPDLVDERFNAGHVTEAEWTSRRKLHMALVGATP